MPKYGTTTDARDRGRVSAERRPEARPRLLRREDLEMLSRELGVVTATGERYGGLRVCRILGRPARRPSRATRRPNGAATDAELARLIRRVLSESLPDGEGYGKVRARLPSRHRMRTATKRESPGEE